MPRRKLSAGKATWPGRKQVWRRHGRDGRMAGDVLSLEDDNQAGTPLLRLVMRDGKRIQQPPTLAEARAHAARELEQLPDPLRRLEPGASYSVGVGEKLVSLAAEVDRHLHALRAPQ